MKKSAIQPWWSTRDVSVSICIRPTRQGRVLLDRYALQFQSKMSSSSSSILFSQVVCPCCSDADAAPAFDASEPEKLLFHLAELHASSSLTQLQPLAETWDVSVSCTHCSVVFSPLKQGLTKLREHVEQHRLHEVEHKSVRWDMTPEIKALRRLEQNQSAGAAEDADGPICSMCNCLLRPCSSDSSERFNIHGLVLDEKTQEPLTPGKHCWHIFLMAGMLRQQEEQKDMGDWFTAMQKHPQLFTKWVLEEKSRQKKNKQPPRTLEQVCRDQVRHYLVQMCQKKNGGGFCLHENDKEGYPCRPVVADRTCVRFQTVISFLLSMDLAKTQILGLVAGVGFLGYSPAQGGDDKERQAVQALIAALVQPLIPLLPSSQAQNELLQWSVSCFFLPEFLKPFRTTQTPMDKLFQGLSLGSAQPIV